MKTRKNGYKRFHSLSRLRADTSATANLLTQLYRPYDLVAKKRSQKQAKRTHFLTPLSPRWWITKSTQLPLAAKTLLFGKMGLKGNLSLAIEDMRGGPDALCIPVSKSTHYIQPKGGYHKWRGFYRAAISHEVTHALGLSKNNLVAATAIENYLLKIRQARTEGLNPSALLDQRKKVQAINSSFGGWRKFLPVEHMKVRGLAPSDLGRSLGYFAAELETKLRKPGLGGVLVREVSNGTPLLRAVEKAKHGEYNLEAELWLHRAAKEYPRIVNFHFGREWKGDYAFAA